MTGSGSSNPGDARLPGPRQAPLLWIGVLLYFTTTGVVEAWQQLVIYGDGTESFARLLLDGLSDYYGWMLVFVGALSVAFRIRLTRGNLWRIVALGALLLGARLIALEVIGTIYPRWFIPGWAIIRLVPSWFAAILAYFSAGYALAFYARYREQERGVTRLRGEIAVADVDALSSAVRPRFLLATLGRIARRMRFDTPAADRMLVRLGDFLRLVLRRTAVRATRVTDEVELVRAYWELREAAPGSPAASLQIEVDPVLLKTRMPPAVLETLVDSIADAGYPAGAAAPIRIEIRSGGMMEITLTAEKHERVDSFQEELQTRLEGLSLERFELQVSRIAPRIVTVRLSIPFLHDSADAPRVEPVAGERHYEPGGDEVLGWSWPAFLLVGATVSLLNGYSSQAAALFGGPAPHPWAFVLNGLVFSTLMLLGAGLILLARRFPIDPDRLGPASGLAIGSVFAATLLYALSRYAIGVSGWFGNNGEVPLGGVLLANMPLAYHLLFCVSAVGHGSYYLAGIRAKTLESLELKAELAESQLSLLKMQLQPHFLFNTLNSVSALMRADVAAAEEMLRRLTRLFRVSLQSSGVSSVTLGEEVEFASEYLLIEQTRLMDRMEVEISVERDVEDALVPHLFLQPIVENAVRHGIAPNHESSRLHLSAREVDGRLEVIVADTGVGLGGFKVPGSGLGLGNTRARLSRLYGADHSLELTPNPGGGTRVRIVLPLAYPATTTEGVNTGSRISRRHLDAQVGALADRPLRSG